MRYFYCHPGIWSPFHKPTGVKAKYAFIRLSIEEKSLLEGLSTPIELVYGTINRLHLLKSSTVLHVKNAAGTDIALSVKRFSTCQHRIIEDGGMAFLPPSETSAEVIPDSAQGKIVVDMTVGQLYKYGEFLGKFGLVDSPVTLIIENGIIADICGGNMADELKAKLFVLGKSCRTLVELGHGLSKMTPTGLIGVDESIIDSCHFGFGDSTLCGVHLDCVINRPTISQR
ncbi:MAG: hypothetical protein PHE50_10450 [Dehalococcoidales bacterium]|nr:hypothetical protein [Dehalococcoidales bacterium]